jgi:ABC-2 type transport system ATP-binding protein
MGLEAKKNKLAGTLSGGMKRRMNIILVLMHDPSILVFDEPEAGLDPQSRILVREFIRDTAREKTVIVTTHNMDEADRLTDRVGIIDRGRLLKLDTPSALKKSIGEGDILEITAVAERPGQLDTAVQNLSSALFEARGEGDRILIRSRNLVPRIPEIYSILGSSGVKVAAMNLRENTLEDVFIHLTGKSLRS